jgi:hypothetical protein
MLMMMLLGDGANMKDEENLLQTSNSRTNITEEDDAAIVEDCNCTAWPIPT